MNLLGPRIVDEADDAPEDEIEFVPAWIDYTDETYGRCLFLAFSGYDEENTYSGRNGNFDWDAHYREMNERFSQSSTVQMLEADCHVHRAGNVATHKRRVLSRQRIGRSLSNFLAFGRQIVSRKFGTFQYIA